MSEILKRVGTVWLICCFATVYIDSAAPDDKGKPPPGPPPDNNTSPSSSPSGKDSGLLPTLLPNIDPLCSQDICSTTRGQSFFPLANNCSFYYKCAGKSDPKLERCGLGQLFSILTYQCEISLDLSICLQCPSTATSRSSSTTSQSITFPSPTTRSTTTMSTTLRSMSPASTTRESTTTTSTTSRSATSSSTTLGSTTTTSTTTRSTTPSSTTVGSTTSRSTTPSSTIHGSTTAASNTSTTTTGQGVLSSSRSANTSAAPVEATTGETDQTTSLATTDNTTEQSFTTSLATTDNTTEQSFTTSMKTSASISSFDGAAQSNTTSTVDVANATRSTTDAVDAEDTSSGDTTWTSASSPHESVNSSFSAADTSIAGGIHGVTTERDSGFSNSTSTVAAVVFSNNTTTTKSTTSSTTGFSSTISTTNTANTSNTTSSSGTGSILNNSDTRSVSDISSTVSTDNRPTSAPSSNASSPALPSSGLTTSEKPGDVTSSWTVSDDSSSNSKSVTQEVNDDSMTSHSFTTPVISERFRREILFTRVSPEVVSEGTELEFECAFIWQTDHGNARIDQFIWILNGKQVESTGRIVIHQPTTVSPDEFWKSTIRFNPAVSQDSGNLTCWAATSGFINSTYYLYEVLPKPRVTVTPVFTTIRAGENALLNCTAYVTLNSNKTIGNARRLTWLKNDHVLRVDEFPDLFTNEVIVSELNLTIPDSDVSVTCLVETSLVNVSSRGAIVRVVKIELGNSCPSETDAGIEWNMTPLGSFDMQPCPYGWLGLARRGCKVDSTWESPDIDQCITKKLIDLQNEVTRVRYRNDVLDNMTMTRLAEDIAETISSLENMTSAELELSIEIVSSMSEIHAGGGLQIALGPTELRVMLKTFDYLLNARSWDRAPKTSAISLLNTINSYSDMYSQQPKNRGIFIVSENLVFEADGLQSLSSTSPTESDSRFPDWTKVNWTTEDAAFWASSSDNVITMSRQTTFKLMQMSAMSSSMSMNYTSSCIRKLGKLLPLTEDQERNGSYINSHIISLTFTGINISRSLDQPFVIAAEHLKAETNESFTGVCVFWEFSSNDNESWTEFGCTTVSSNETHTTCSCNHLTNFAILMSPKNADGLDVVILSIISMVGCIVSAISLALTIILYFTQWKKMKSKRAAILINLCVALIIANIIFLAGSDKTQSQAGCTVVAALLHYFFLAAFFLMLLEGVMLLIYIVCVFHVHRTSHTVAMIVAAWFIPAVIVAISLGVTKTRGYGTETTCWLSVEENVLWAFVAPALFIILVNLIIIVIVLSRIVAAKVRSDVKKKQNKIVSMLRNIVILSPIMGVTWVFGVLSVSAETEAFQYIFAITNSLQGLFIFILHGLCHMKNKKSSAKQKNHRLNGALSRSAVPRIQIPLSETDSQEDLVTTTKPEREMCIEEELHKYNSVHKVNFTQQLSNTSHTSNGTALTYMSNNSSSNGRLSVANASG